MHESIASLPIKKKTHHLYHDTTINPTIFHFALKKWSTSATVCVHENRFSTNNSCDVTRQIQMEKRTHSWDYYDITKNTLGSNGKHLCGVALTTHVWLVLQASESLGWIT